MNGSTHFDKKSNRYFISVYWKSKRYKFWRDPVSLEPFWHEKTARKWLGKLQAEIDAKTFNPAAWSPKNPLSTSNYCLEWLITCEASTKTIRSGYQGYIKNYINPFFQNRDIRELRANDIKLFKIHLETCQLASKTIYNIMSGLRTILRDAWRNEDIQKIPPFPRLSVELPEIQYLTIDQQNKILDAIPAAHRPIFQLAMEYGLRIGEARAIQKDSIRDGLLIIKRAFSDNTLQEKTKTGKIRTYELTEYATEVLRSVPRQLSLFIFTREDGKPYTNKNLNQIWQKAGGKTGIKIKLYNAVRHSLGCQLLDMGYDIDLVREQLGHTKADMTRRYAKRSKARLTEALENRRGKVLPLEKIYKKNK